MSFDRPIPDLLPEEKRYLANVRPVEFFEHAPDFVSGSEAYREAVRARNARRKTVRRVTNAILWIPKAFVALWYVPSEFFLPVWLGVTTGSWQFCPSAGACSQIAYPNPNFLLGFGFGYGKFVIALWLATAFVLWRTRFQDKSLAIGGWYLKIGAFGFLAYVGLHFFRSVAGFDFQW